MSLNSRILLLILSILASSNNITSAQIEQDNSQQVAKQEKPTLRKKIIKWGGIITGIGATIAGAAWLYFHKDQSGRQQIQIPQQEIDRANQEVMRRLESEFINRLEDTPNLIELEQLYQSGQFKGGESEKAYNRKKAEFTQKIEQSAVIKTKQAFINAINTANTLHDLFDLQLMTQDNIETPKGFKTLDEYKELVEDPEVIDVYYSKEPLVYLQTIQDVSDPEQRAERIQLYIDKIIGNSHTYRLLDAKYKALQKINNQEFNDVLQSNKVQEALTKEREQLLKKPNTLFYQRNINYKGQYRNLFL